MNIKQLTNKSVNHLLYKYEIYQKEKTFQNRLKYVLEKEPNSNVLLVVFSGFSYHLSRAKYQYMKTLQQIRCNRLYVLDDYGFQKCGVYYLGEHGDFYVRAIVLDLVKQTIQELGTKFLITAGSSKGGACAIYFGLKLNGHAIIAGAPQYYIGNYLDTDTHRSILHGILGRGGERSS